MATERTILCADCGQATATKRQNTKYCPLCRLLRDLLYVGGMKRECWICEREYAPLTYKRDPSEMCGECDTLTRNRYVEGDCSYCQQHKHNLLNSDVRVCVRCALDPANRARLVRALQRKQAARAEENGRRLAAQLVEAA